MHIHFSWCFRKSMPEKGDKFNRRHQSKEKTDAIIGGPFVKTPMLQGAGEGVSCSCRRPLGWCQITRTLCSSGWRRCTRPVWACPRTLPWATAQRHTPRAGWLSPSPPSQAEKLCASPGPYRALLPPVAASPCMAACCGCTCSLSNYMTSSEHSTHTSSSRLL